MSDARQLLASVVPGRLDQRVADQLVAEARGNPLALLELPRGLTPAELAGGFGLPEALPLEGRIEDRFVQRLEALPADTRRLLLVAAADPTGDPALVWRAAARLGLTDAALEPLAGADLIEIGARVRFRHPLVRSAVYRAAAPDERRRVRAALAEATDPRVDPDRRAWHLAAATAGPDESVAGELERAAGRAQARGGLAAAAAFLERAAALTPDRVRRAQRALAAAQTKYEAGALDDALALLATAETGGVDDLQRARVDLLRAQIAFAVQRGGDAPALLLEAARELEAVDPDRARTTYLEALDAARFADRLARGADVVEVSKAALAGPAPRRPPRPTDLLLAGDGDAAHRRSRRGRADPQGRAERVPRGDRPPARGVALALVRLPRRVGRLGRGELEAARHARAPACPRCRCPHGHAAAPQLAQLPPGPLRRAVRRRSRCSTRSGRPSRRPASPLIATSRSGSRRCAGASRSSRRWSRTSPRTRRREGRASRWRSPRRPARSCTTVWVATRRPSPRCARPSTSRPIPS